MQNSNSMAKQDSVMVSILDAAQIVGCSYDTIRRAVISGQLRSARLGQGRQGKRMIKRSDLFEWLDRRVSQEVNVA